MGFKLVFYIFGLLPLYLYLPLWVPNIVVLQVNEPVLLPGVMWYSGVILGGLVFWAVNQRTTGYSYQWGYFLIFPLVIYIYTHTVNLLIFFICYELFLLPSFFIIFLHSPNRRNVLASIYFLMWTQVGSFLILCVIIYVYISSSTLLSTYLVYKSAYIYILVFIGFGIKVPLWPFHYWLTKTHVEAPTYFSIYLSGFLVKTALYGFWVFTYVFSGINLLWVIAVVTVGIIDSSLKMWYQVDLKKLVAYATVQEMNLILIGFILGNHLVVGGVSLFILAHTILSTLFFYIVDSIYRRFLTRNIYGVGGIMLYNTFLGYIIFTSVFLFGGIPFTLKFIVEVYIFAQLYGIYPPLFTAVLVCCNWIGLTIFARAWLCALFGNFTPFNAALITPKELYTYLNLFILLFILPVISIICA